MLINKSGTVNFWFDPQKNPFAFQEGNNVHWGQFILEGENCIIISEGQTLSVIMNHNSERELVIFQTHISPDANNKHMVTVTWSSENVCLYFDAVLQQEIRPSDLEMH